MNTLNTWNRWVSHLKKFNNAVSNLNIMLNQIRFRLSQLNDLDKDYLNNINNNINNNIKAVEDFQIQSESRSKVKDVKNKINGHILNVNECKESVLSNAKLILKLLTEKAPLTEAYSSNISNTATAIPHVKSPPSGVSLFSSHSTNHAGPNEVNQFGSCLLQNMDPDNPNAIAEVLSLVSESKMQKSLGHIQQGAAHFQQGAAHFMKSEALKTKAMSVALQAGTPTKQKKILNDPVARLFVTNTLGNAFVPAQLPAKDHSMLQNGPVLPLQVARPFGYNQSSQNQPELMRHLTKPLETSTPIASRNGSTSNGSAPQWVVVNGQRVPNFLPTSFFPREHA
ncbi:hypothetical protein [Candidatus Cardinium hertigii]|uniref:Uncharacterized protein n=1 Tax=Candidatus Cardinium hertigii TaxID=247481 RepID=A0A3N2QBR6_9BACT|nr:hypothetical protein [Candidatus Cardinium hertigii]ROT47244.1 hypothetical protein EDM02_03785 [Candidatus Cardinium hertigii]